MTRGRQVRRRRGAVLAGALTVAAAAAINVVPAAVPTADAAASCYGAASIARGAGCARTVSGPVVPSIAKAPSDRSSAYKYDCQVKPPFTDRFSCRFGDRTAKTKIALVGNSHAMQWLPALVKIAQAHGFSVTTFVASGCVATETRQKVTSPTESENCYRWGKWARESVARGNFDLVVQSELTLGYAVSGEDRVPAFTGGYIKHLRRWVEADKKVLVIRDTPRPGFNVPDCLRKHPTNYMKCSGPQEKWLLTDPLVRAAKTFEGQGVSVATMTKYFCRSGTCTSVIGRVIAYLDHSHLTATYARSLAPYLEPHVMNALRG